MKHRAVSEPHRVSDVAPQAPIKVLYLAPASPRGQALAAQSFIEEEIRAIREWNVRPFILTDEIRSRVAREGIQLIGLRRLRSLRDSVRFAALVLRRLPLLLNCLLRSWQPRKLLHAFRIEYAAAKLVRRERIDLIHSHFGWPGGLGGSVAAARAGVPLVASMRGTDVLLRKDLNYGLRLDRAYQCALRHLLGRASRILVATDFMRRATLDVGGDGSRLEVLAKGVDTETFSPRFDRGSAKRALSLSGPIVLAVGNLQRRKGFDQMIAALASLPQQEWTLVICGAGAERGALEAQAARAGIGDRVRFEGHVSRTRIALYFAAADIFVHAAELEAAGNVILEALASGCAVICTDSGGPGEYVTDGRSGFVVPVGDVAALAARLRDVLRSPDLQHRFGREGRRRVEASHTYGRMMSGLRRIYEQVLAEAAGHTSPSPEADAVSRRESGSPAARDVQPL